LPGPALLVAPDGSVLGANEPLRALLGWPVDARGSPDLLGLLAGARSAELLAEAGRGAPYRGETVVVLPGGVAVELEVVARPFDGAAAIVVTARDVTAARRDLVRICSEIREEVEAPSELAAHGTAPEPPAAQRIKGALYVSCAGRGGPHFGGPSAELKIVQHALGDVPLVGFFAGGEIARHHLYGYTGVLTVFSSAGG